MYNGCRMFLYERIPVSAWTVERSGGIRSILQLYKDKFYTAKHRYWEWMIVERNLKSQAKLDLKLKNNDLD